VRVRACSQRLQEKKDGRLQSSEFISEYVFEHDKLINCREQFIVFVYSQRTNNGRIIRSLTKETVKWSDVSS
jgi:hypothetical protein